MLAAYEGIWPPSQWAWRSYSSLMGRRRKRYCPSDLPLRFIPPLRFAFLLLSGLKRYCPSDLPLRSIPPRLTARCLPLTAAGGQGPQGRGWPGSSGQHRLRPCHPLLPFIAKVARTSSAYGRGWPGSSGQHRLRPMHKSTVSIPCLLARSTHKPFAPLPPHFA